MIEIAETRSPVGPLRIAVAGGRLAALVFADGWEAAERRLAARFRGEDLKPARDPAGVVARLGAYFEGDLAAFGGIDVDAGGTPFQRRVWAALRAVKAGRTASYADLARAARSARAVRAVGTAMGANPVCIVVPCHRIVRSDGSLGGYGGGLDRKRWLLEHERRHASS